MQTRSRRTPILRVLISVLAATSTLAVANSAYADITGPDVSSWQHPNGAKIDWSQVKSAGRAFTFVKATEGPAGYYTNPYFAADWSAIRAAGMYRGAYHFAQPATPTDASASNQAQNFISVVGNTSAAGDLPPALDLEVTNGLSPADMIAWTRSFVSTVQALTGRRPLIYTSPYFWSTALGNSTAFTGYPLWIAHWTSAPAPTLPGGWASYTFWQYTNVGSVPGISGNVDLSRYCCDPASLKALADGGASQLVAATGTGGAVWMNRDHAGWVSLGGVALGSPSVISLPDPSGAVPLFIVTGADHRLWARTPSAGWQHLDNTPGTYCIDNPAAMLVGTTLTVACQGSDHQLFLNSATVSAANVPTLTSGWSAKGGNLIAGPAMANVPPRGAAIMVTTAGRAVFEFSAGGWHGTPFLCNGHPALASDSLNTPTTAYFACQGTDAALWWSQSTSGGWSGATSLGGQLIDGPGIAATNQGPTFYGEGLDHQVYERTLNSPWSVDGGFVNFGTGAAAPF